MEFIAQNERKTTLKENGKSYRVYLRDISYIKSDSYLSIVHFVTEREPIIVSKLLKEFEKELFKYGYLRISRFILINKVHIFSIGSCKDRVIILKEGEKLTISHRKYAKIIKIIENP